MKPMLLAFSKTLRTATNALVLWLLPTDPNLRTSPLTHLCKLQDSALGPRGADMLSQGSAPSKRQKCPKVSMALLFWGSGRLCLVVPSD